MQLPLWAGSLLGGVGSWGLGELFGEDRPDYPMPTAKELEIRDLLYQYAKAGIPRDILEKMYAKLRESAEVAEEEKLRATGATFRRRGLRTTGLLTETEKDIRTSMLEELMRGKRDIEIEAELTKPRWMAAYLGVPRPERLGAYGAELAEYGERAGKIGGLQDILTKLLGGRPQASMPTTSWLTSTTQPYQESWRQMGGQRPYLGTKTPYKLWG